MKYVALLLLVPLAVFAPDTNRVTISWSSVSGTTGYVVRSGPNPQTLPLLTFSTNGLQRTLTNLTMRPWYYAVWALNNQGRPTLITNQVNVIVGTTTNRVNWTNQLSDRMGSNVVSYPCWPSNQTLRFQ